MGYKKPRKKGIRSKAPKCPKVKMPTAKQLKLPKVYSVAPKRRSSKKKK